MGIADEAELQVPEADGKRQTGTNLERGHEVPAQRQPAHYFDDIAVPWYSDLQYRTAGLHDLYGIYNLFQGRRSSAAV